jgi:hypothetical protein
MVQLRSCCHRRMELLRRFVSARDRVGIGPIIGVVGNSIDNFWRGN